jgi:hypothetical protein
MTSTTLTTTIESETKTTYCQRFRAEINPCTKYSWFSTTDPASGRTIDIKESFAYIPFNNSTTSNINILAFIVTILWKLVIVTIGWTSLVLGITNRKDTIPGFFFAYLSNWGVTMCCIYLTFSLVNCVLRISRKQQQQVEQEITDVVSWRIFVTWISFIIGIHTTAVATLLFWILIYDPNDTIIRFTTITAHGGLFLLLLVDGLLLNRIPIRFMYWIGILVPFDLIFITWSIIHDLGTNLGNPDNNDTDILTNDDALYKGVLEWDTKPATAVKWTIICVFVLGPILFVLLWTVSTNICGDRLRYHTNIQKMHNGPSDKISNDDDEEELAFQEVDIHVTP